LRHKSIAILAYLATEARPLSRDTLATLFWPASGQARARGNLRSCLWQISEAVGNGVLKSQDELLEADFECLAADVHDFFLLLSSSDVSEAPQKREEILEKTERLCRGNFMEGFTLTDCSDFDTWELFQEELFRRQLSGVLDELTELKIRRAAWNEALCLCRRRIELDPVEEASHRQMMRILAVSGRRAEALRQFDECVSFLRIELGEEPDAKTVRLMKDIKSGAFAPAADGSIQPLELSEQRTAPAALPQETTSFIGRSEELETIRSLLESGTRLLTLTGPAGTGKTRLALRAAYSLKERYPGGCFFVDLSPLEEGADVPKAVAAAVGLREAFPSRDDMLRTLAQRFSGSSSLLVLDNFEHLLDAAPFPAELIERAGELTILVTSREALHAAGEDVLFVPPLDTDDPAASDSVALFLDRTRSALGEAAACALEKRGVRELCRHLDGLPLAIELAVPLLRIFTLGELIPRLAAPLDYLSSAESVRPNKHRSLGLAIDWSYRLLQPEEAGLFASLSVFAGPFTLAAVHRICSVCAEDRRTAEGLRSLVEKSLVLVLPDIQEGSRRFTLLQSVRHYAASRAGEMGIDASLRKNHAEYFAAFISDRTRVLHGPQMERALEELRAVDADILRALAFFEETGEYERGLALAAELYWYWYRGGRFSTGERQLSIFLSKVSDSSAGLRARGLQARAWMLFAGGKWRKAHTLYAEALYFSRLAGDTDCEARSLSGVGVTARWMGDVSRGTGYTEQAVEVARSSGDPALLIHTLIWAYATTGGEFAGEPPIQQLQEAGMLARRLGNRWYYAHVLNGLGDLFSRLGAYDRAEANYLLSLHEYERLGDRFMIAWNEEGLGLTALRRGASKKAGNHTVRALRLFNEVGDELDLAIMLVRLADIFSRLSRRPQAARFAGAASTVIDALAGTDMARSPRIEEAQRRCAEYEDELPLEWAAGRNTPRHEIIAEAEREAAEPAET
jgi:predicted ATPase/DNA-binding SARP family transcriptional activator